MLTQLIIAGDVILEFLQTKVEWIGEPVHVEGEKSYYIEALINNEKVREEEEEREEEEREEREGEGGEGEGGSK